MLILSRKTLSGMTIVIGEATHPLERHAAMELRRYLGKCFGFAPPVVDESARYADKGHAFFLGTAKTFPAGILNLKGRVLGIEEFVIARKGEGIYFLGGSPRGLLYAVYHFLERVCGVGFFADGDRIPRHVSLDVSNLNLMESPRFPWRIYSTFCAVNYTARYWQWADWRRELDWMAKNKLNLLYSFPGWYYQGNWGYPPCTSVAKRVMRQFGVDIGPPTTWERFNEKLSLKICRYARKLGIEIVAPMPDGRVPDAFRSRFPGARYITVQWQNSFGYYIHPADPLYHEVGKAFLKEYERLFGPSRFFISFLYSESTPGSTEEEEKELKESTPRAAVSLLRETNPQAVWILESWTFLSAKDGKRYWQKGDIRALLSQWPAEQTLFVNIVAEQFPMYKELNYFWGRPWGFAVLHAFAGSATLHGDLKGLIRQVQGLLTNRRARRLVNLGLTPELMRHSPLFGFLVPKLAWRPDEINPKRFLEDYACLRYGADSASTMGKALIELARSVYGKTYSQPPLYQASLGYSSLAISDGAKLLDNEYHPYTLERCRPVPLRKALDIALVVKEKLKDGPHYTRDLIDIYRQYVGDLFTQACLKMIDAYRNKDSRRVSRLAETLRSLVTYQMEVLQTHPDFILSQELVRADAIPQRRAEWSNRQDVWRKFTIWDNIEEYPALLDYCHTDIYELLKYYYQPRLDCFINHLRRRLPLGKPISSEVLGRNYQKLVQALLTRVDSMKNNPAKVSEDIPSSIERNLQKIDILCASDSAEEAGP